MASREGWGLGRGVTGLQWEHRYRRVCSGAPGATLRPHTCFPQPVAGHQPRREGETVALGGRQNPGDR